MRARRPYIVRNIATGAALFSFCIGVCTRHPLLPMAASRGYSTLTRGHLILDAFTINAVGQDDFSDVKVPDAPVAKQAAK